VSIVHRALKKAQSDEQKRGQSTEGAHLYRHAEGKKQIAKRLLIIFTVFLVLLAFLSYFPVYYKNKKLRRIKESISIKTDSITPPVNREPAQPEKVMTKTYTKDNEPFKDELLEESAEALNKKGIYFYSNGQYNEAYKYFSAALKKDKADCETYNNLGLTLKRQKKYKDALLNFKRALSLNEHYKECYNNIGVLYDHLGQHKEAVEAFRQAIEIEKDYKDPYFNIAATYEKMKEYELANAYYKDYLSFFKGEDDGFIKGIRKKVEILSKVLRNQGD
jgi:tetratricopeptide (TPR) repeat protein